MIKIEYIKLEHFFNKMDNFLNSVIDLEIKKFSEKISEIHKKNKWEIFAIHKWGYFDPKESIIEKNTNLFVRDENNVVYAKIVNWQPEPC